MNFINTKQTGIPTIHSDTNRSVTQQRHSVQRSSTFCINVNPERPRSEALERRRKAGLLEAITESTPKSFPLNTMEIHAPSLRQELGIIEGKRMNVLALCLAILAVNSGLEPDGLHLEDGWDSDLESVSGSENVSETGSEKMQITTGR